MINFFKRKIEVNKWFPCRYCTSNDSWGISAAEDTFFICNTCFKKVCDTILLKENK